MREEKNINVNSCLYMSVQPALSQYDPYNQSDQDFSASRYLLANLCSNILDPFGNVIYKEGSDKNDYTFAGKEKDESGLFYFVARYYDPTLGRFISRDVMRGVVDNPITQHPYVYTANNPLRYIDPTGNMPKDSQTGTEKTADSIEKLTDDKKTPEAKTTEDEKKDDEKEKSEEEKKLDDDKKSPEEKKNETDRKDKAEESKKTETKEDIKEKSLDGSKKANNQEDKSAEKPKKEKSEGEKYTEKMKERVSKYPELKDKTYEALKYMKKYGNIEDTDNILAIKYVMETEFHPEDVIIKVVRTVSKQRGYLEHLGENLRGEGGLEKWIKNAEEMLEPSTKLKAWEIKGRLRKDEWEKLEKPVFSAMETRVKFDLKWTTTHRQYKYDYYRKREK